MKNSVKNIAAFIILLQIVCVIILVGCANNSHVKRLEMEYDITLNLPKGSKAVCAERGETFTGKAPRYTVFELTEEPTEFLNSFKKVREDYDGVDFENKYEVEKFSTQKNLEFEEIIDRDVNSQLKIDEKYRPNWEVGYLWKKHSSLYIAYFPSAMRLIFYEEGY